MSILIKDMKMPESCFECPFMFARRYCRADLTLNLYQGDYDELTGRVVGCPLVEVPPHGDLIDRDKLPYSRIRIAHPTGNIGGWNAVVMSAAIKDAPVIIPAEEGGETR